MLVHFSTECLNVQYYYKTVAIEEFKTTVLKILRFFPIILEVAKMATITLYVSSIFFSLISYAFDKSEYFMWYVYTVHFQI